MRTRHVLAGAVALALAGTATGATAASGHSTSKAEPTVTAIAKKLVGPLSVAQAPDGTRYWTDSFAGPLYKQSPNGQPAVVFAGSKKAAAEGVSADGGVLRFTTGSPDNSAGKVWTLDPVSGAPVLVADTGKFEKANNPDKGNHYGFVGTPASCLKQLGHDVPPPYTGVKETHPYATASASGVTYVADAGGNDILAISATGVVSAVTVLKPVYAKITPSAADSLGLPDCTIGKRFGLEPVPTDIEVGTDGQLYVTSLPGGPEDPSLGANGRVLKINPATGKVTTLVSGLITPTGVAVASNGDIYVTQLFLGLISKIKAGSSKAKPYIQLPLPAAVEATPQGLLATIHAVPGKKPKGQVVKITP
jgi:hypothetical protein